MALADPECKTNLRAQRSFAQVSSLLELMASAAGLEGEVRGTKVALCECSRLIDVAQPLAGAWLQAIHPGPRPVQAALDAVLIALRGTALR
jgi:hypothetical protein